jgi:hypothetical protein
MNRAGGIALVLLAWAAALLAAQGRDSMPPVPPADTVHHRSLDVGVHDTGLSIGNSRRWTGLRINLSDHGVERVIGLNLTLGRARENTDARVDGIAVGLLAPVAGTIRGVAVGPFGVVAEHGLAGVNVGGLAVVSQGAIEGLSVAGLGLVGE